MPPEELQARYLAAGFANLSVARKTAQDWYCLLHRMQGAAALPHILDGSLGHQVDRTEFENDTAFCEWAYFVDWEERELIVSHGGLEEVKDFAGLTEDWMLHIFQDEGDGDEE